MSKSCQSFIGVDLHKCTVTLTAVDPAGEMISRLKISTKSTGKIEDWLLGLPRASWMAVEACPFVEWFIDRFRDCVGRIDIADATEFASLRGKRRKTDFNDSLDIAKRLARGGKTTGQALCFAVFRCHSVIAWCDSEYLGRKNWD